MKVLSNIKKKGFTLVEILIVIIILGILLLIAVPTINNIIENNKKKAFFTSVSNIVNSLKPIDVLEKNEFCLYDYSKDSTNQTENIKSLYVLMHVKDNKNIYSVFASYKEKSIGIDIYDFSTLSISNSSEWVQTPTQIQIESADYLNGEILSATEALVEQLNEKGIPKDCYVDKGGN